MKYSSSAPPLPSPPPSIWFTSPILPENIEPCSMNFKKSQPPMNKGGSYYTEATYNLPPPYLVCKGRKILISLHFVTIGNWYW